MSNEIRHYIKFNIAYVIFIHFYPPSDEFGAEGYGVASDGRPGVRPSVRI